MIGGTQTRNQCAINIYLNFDCTIGNVKAIQPSQMEIKRSISIGKLSA